MRQTRTFAITQQALNVAQELMPKATDDERIFFALTMLEWARDHLFRQGWALRPDGTMDADDIHIRRAGSR